jgi:hypothetical protein
MHETGNVFLLIRKAKGRNSSGELGLCGMILLEWMWKVCSVHVKELYPSQYRYQQWLLETKVT